MKNFEQVKQDKRVKKTYPGFMGIGYAGEIELKGERSTFIFIASIDGEKMEHVSVHINGSTKKTPSWEQMCQIKDIFWDDEEEVHQIHPKKSEYISGVGDGKGTLENILHLWRPVGGWKE